MPIKESFRSQSSKLRVVNASVNNLQNVSVDIPIGVMTVVTGVAGSRKSSLIHQTFLRQRGEYSFVPINLVLGGVAAFIAYGGL